MLICVVSNCDITNDNSDLLDRSFRLGLTLSFSRRLSGLLPGDDLRPLYLSSSKPRLLGEMDRRRGGLLLRGGDRRGGLYREWRKGEYLLLSSRSRDLDLLWGDLWSRSRDLLLLGDLKFIILSISNLIWEFQSNFKTEFQSKFKTEFQSNFKTEFQSIQDLSLFSQMKTGKTGKD